MKMRVLAAAAFALALAPRVASAFCGFYVGGADQRLYNNATQVVLMREGTRTVLSMQNNYQGPPADFAMVVPVPVVLQKENVKTLPKAVFERVDQLASPRLVEYWEQDPCGVSPDLKLAGGGGLSGLGVSAGGAPRSSGGVRIEAQFEVGEYDIVILSATDALALEQWLKGNNYKIPTGSEPYLRPYVQQGMRFFVAKVDVAKVKFVNGQAELSPLRFHYDSEQFFLPIRLGLINSSGAQDLIVNILAQNQRYDVTNYDNVAMPTNIDVSDATRNNFPGFYTALFDKTVAKRPKTVITEYSWQATSCDPCPVQPLSQSELSVLGADVLPSTQAAGDAPTGGGTGAPMRRPPPFYGGSSFVLTRLHARYTKDALGEDLFFRAAAPIVGGRESVTGANGKLEEGAKPAASNNFQSRYVIRHPWTGAVACAQPRRGVWGGPPGSGYGSSAQVKAAPRLGTAQRGGVQLAALLKGGAADETFLAAGGTTPVLSLTPPVGMVADASAPDVPDASSPPQADAAPATVPPPTVEPKAGCAGCATSGSGTSTAIGVGALGTLVGLLLRRRRR
jgi:MYXO-CTERM domain-containing protein